MSIIDTVEEVAIEFERLTGRKPKYLYVGYGEILAIRLIAQAEYVGRVHITKDRIECCGLPVFTVNAEKHLRVS